MTTTRALGVSRGLASLAVLALIIAGCSSDAATSPDTSTNTSDVVDADVFAPDTAGESTPTNPFDTNEPDVVVVDANPTDTLPDDVIIATDDGLIPTTTEPSPPTTEAATPTTATPPVVVPATVSRIISLSPTHTETIAALGAQDLLVAVDDRSDIPAGIDELHVEGVSAEEVDLSTMLSFEPDLVLIGDDLFGIEGAFAQEGVATVVGPPATSLIEVYEQITEIAAAIGREEEGQVLVSEMRDRVQRISAEVDALGLGDATFFHEFNPDLATPTAPGLLADLYGQLGLTNIADDNGAATGRLTTDEILEADPTVILLADVECCGANAATVGARPGWDELSAVQNGTILELSDALAQRWGPRTVDLIELVGGALLVAE